MDGKEFSGPINVDIVNKYYAWGHQKKDLLELKTRKGGLGKKRKKRERFKVKTWKGSLNHKKWDKKWKKKEKMKGQVENPKGRLDYEKYT